MCLAVGGYTSLIGCEKDIASEELLLITVDQQEKLTVECLDLKSGPLAQSSLLKTPEPHVYIVAGGIQERWALISNYVAPAVPCDMQAKQKCLLVNEKTQYVGDVVNWLGCDGPCSRWFHINCVMITNEEFNIVAKRKKWFCNMSDCK